MARCNFALIVATTLGAAGAWGQPNVADPHLGYLYPAGGQQGATFQIKAGGQWLQGVNEIHISGEGVEGTVTQYIRALTRQEIGRIGQHIRKFEREIRDEQARAAGKPESAAARPELQPLPEHAVVEGIEEMNLLELAALRAELFDPKKQPNAQIAATTLIDVTIAPDAATGDREMRLGTPNGLTNPMVFQVGVLPEVSEYEPEKIGPAAAPQVAPPLDLPVLINGQIEPGDMDRFRFTAVQGQRLVIETRARHLVPYLADAVPGWFQATLALYDSAGKELAFADDYRFSPDPVLLYEVPTTGEYAVEIRDSIYRGREDFVYRIGIGELPFITQMFPLGGVAGSEVVAEIDGWNLPTKQLTLNTEPGGTEIRHTALRQGGSLSNPVAYAVGDRPESTETEPNNTADEAQLVHLPVTINGRIAEAGDVDVFKFTGLAGQGITAEVHGRRLMSPIDSLLRLTDASGTVLEWSDDYEDKGMGLCTHHADSFVSAKLAEDGMYYVRMRDSQNHGGDAYAYRLSITPPQPDFALRINPSSVSLRAGGSAPLSVHALRKNGFEGAIEVALKNAPVGFELSGARIPEGLDSINITLRAPRAWLKDPYVLEMEGRAVIDGETVTRPAVPSEDMMQAFLYRHLAPSQTFMAQVKRSPPFMPSLELASTDPLRIPSGGGIQMQVNAPDVPALQAVQLELSDAPDGLTIEGVKVVPGGVAFTVKAGADVLDIGYVDNLIVKGTIQVDQMNREGKPTGRKRRVPLGFLPAIPFEVVQG